MTVAIFFEVSGCSLAAFYGLFVVIERVENCDGSRVDKNEEKNL